MLAVLAVLAVLVVLTALAGLAVLAVLAVCFCSRKKKYSKNKHPKKKKGSGVKKTYFMNTSRNGHETADFFLIRG